jgi:hypothetical protein
MVGSFMRGCLLSFLEDAALAMLIVLTVSLFLLAVFILAPNWITLTNPAAPTASLNYFLE